ncbi:MAG: phosphatidate cytidylyltransferase [Planctomycetes bacterium]|nr:phosphatidate cytidylyltransferase [Planctomycetota bacterium]
MLQLFESLSAQVGPIFARYLVAALAVLSVAGALLGVLTLGFKKPLKGVWKTYRGWLVMVPVVLTTLYLGREAVIVGVTLLSILGFKEFARATGLYEDWWYTIVGYVGILVVGALVLMPDPRQGGHGWYGLFMAVPVYAIGLFLVVPVLRNRAKGQLQRVALSIVGFVYLGWMFGHLGFLANSEHAQGYLLYLCFAVPISDVAAFTSGKLFGKAKLRSEISPNKTWGGSLGALAVSMALPWLLRFSFPHFGWVELVLTGLIVGVGGQLGDLTISFIKRDLEIKDMGAAIPGHGGFLDRLDSLIFVAPLFFHMTRWFHNV